MTVLLTAALLAASAFAATNVRRTSTVASTRSTARPAKTSTAKTTKTTAKTTAKTPAKTARTTKSTKTAKISAAARRAAAARARRTRGQQAIQAERVTQIQEALIREHYLTGDADGIWDANTIAAMQKFQKDQGWQTKLMPDSRAIKKLGLGPDYSGAINAKNASFAEPPPISTIPNEQASGFTAASGVRQ